MRWAVYFLFFVEIGQFVSSCVVLGLSWMPPEHLLDGKANPLVGLNATQKFYNANGIISSVTSAAIYITPMFMLRGLAIPRVSSEQRVTLSGIILMRASNRDKSMPLRPCSVWDSYQQQVHTHFPIRVSWHSLTHHHSNLRQDILRLEPRQANRHLLQNHQRHPVDPSRSPLRHRLRLRPNLPITPPRLLPQLLPEPNHRGQRKESSATTWTAGIFTVHRSGHRPRKASRQLVARMGVVVDARAAGFSVDADEREAGESKSGGFERQRADGWRCGGKGGCAAVRESNE